MKCNNHDIEKVIKREKINVVLEEGESYLRVEWTEIPRCTNMVIVSEAGRRCHGVCTYEDYSKAETHVDLIPLQKND